MSKHIIVVGAGASGLIAAGTAIREGARVTVIEKMPRPARKVMITGKGRCNVTNNTDLNGLIASVPQNARFLYSAFSSFGSDDTMALFEGLNVPLKTERGNRVFPVSDKAVDIVDALIRYSKGAEFIHTEAESLIASNGKVIGVLLSDGRKIMGDNIIIATGGKSYPLTGSSGDGYRFAKQLGHTVTSLRPSLVALTAHEGFCEYLQGLSLKNVKISIFKSGKSKPIFTDFGEMLFTHFGISGPIVLSASAHIRDIDTSEYEATIDLKPALSCDQLDQRLLRDFSKFLNRDIDNSLDELLPKKLIPVVIKLSGINPKTKINQITKTDREALITVIKNLRLHITGFRPIEEAVVTSGGVSVKEIDPKTMKSKLVEGLYFAGEVMDVDAYTGGFNLQIAFSTGFVAGKSAAKEGIL